MQRNAKRHKLYHRGHLEGNKYVFSSNNSDEDGDNGEEEYPLKVYKHGTFFEKEVEPGDTLQTLSLQFNCPVAELKRINNIHRDNEIFARRTVKIPAKLFTKKLPGVHGSSSQKVVTEGSDTCTSSESFIDSLNKDMSVIGHVLMAEVPDKELEGLNSMSIPKLHVGDATNECDINTTVLQDIATENFDLECCTVPLIPQEGSTSSKDVKSVYGCNGADRGVSWLQLLICSLLLGFAGPVLYVIYLTEDSNKRT